jgi:hypothetical protein
MTRLSRIALALLVALALATTAVSAVPPSAAAPRTSRMADAAPMDFFVRLWSLLTSAWSKNGCQVDPSGRCLPDTGSVMTTGDNGCGIDPDGHCLPGTGSATATGDNGCHVDPDGLCIK